MRPFCFRILPLCLLKASLCAGPAAAQSVETTVFRVPVEVSDIRYLSSVHVQCTIQDGTRGGPLDVEDWSNGHTISNLVRWVVWAPDFGRCTSDPSGDEASQRCASPGADGGLDWSGVIEVPVRDFDNGRIRVSEGQNYKCSVVVHYDTEPGEAGEAGLSDGLCAGFYSNPFSIDARERYQTFTGGDIAEAELCREGRFAPSGGGMDVTPSFISGGEYRGDTGSETIAGNGASTATINPDLANRLPDNAVRSERLAGVAGNTVRSPMLVQGRDGGGSTVCRDAVQGRIAWNHTGSTQWADANIDSLCAGAESSTQPAMCFDRVMHRGTPRPDGGRWVWQDARELCRGSMNANDTIDCYTGEVAAGAGLAEAISRCQG